MTRTITETRASRDGATRGRAHLGPPLIYEIELETFKLYIVLIGQRGTTVWFIAVGTILLLMKWFELGPVARLSWWIVLAPFIVGLLWFEVVEPIFGFDKKKAHSDMEKFKKERLRKQLERTNRPPR